MVRTPYQLRCVVLNYGTSAPDLGTRFVLRTGMGCNNNSHSISALESLEKAIHRRIIPLGRGRWLYSRMIVVGVKGHILIEEHGITLPQFELLVPIAQVDVIIERMCPNSV